MEMYFELSVTKFNLTFWLWHFTFTLRLDVEFWFVCRMCVQFLYSIYGMVIPL